MKYWDYPFNPKINKEFQLDLGQGNTHMENAPDEILKITKLDSLTFKREDKNPNGSFKDRALAYQISYLYQNKAKYCVLSSSGNAAISCCAFAQKAKIKPIILISPDIPINKLSQIINQKPFLLIKSPQARRLANYISKKYKIINLNPSTNNHAINGFKTLGWEISENNSDSSAIFSYCTSGASILGIYDYYYSKKNINIPQIVGIQSGNQIQLANLFNQNFTGEKQLAGLNTPKNLKELIKYLVNYH
jgi:threonine synthase